MSSEGRWIACHRCEEPIWMTSSVERALRRSGQTFHCLWGHAAVFREGPTEADKLRQERDRLKQEIARHEDEKRIAWNTASAEAERREAAERRAAAARGQVTKLKKRAAVGVCPCCNRQFQDLARHMAGKHPGFLAEEIAGDGATIQ